MDGFDNVLRIWVPVLVVLILSLYFYDVAAHRIYDILLSFVLLVAVSPLFAVLAIVSTVKKGHAFDFSDDDLAFAYPNNRIAFLPRLLLVFIGKRRILPARLKDLRLP